MNDKPISTEQIWELFSDKLRGFLRKRIPDDQIAEDLLQETFLRIHKNLVALDDSQRITAWLYQIARNLVTDHYRSRGRSTTETDTNWEQIADEIDDEAENLNDEVEGWLPKMIDLLPETQREAVRMYELGGITQQEIADRLNISLSGAKSRIQRGRQQLRSLLFDCCSFENDRRGNIIDYTQQGNVDCNMCDEDPSEPSSSCC
ncbi:MAG: RNA polymerase sigma factor SigZ [Planctomycetota bacterium]